MTLLPVTHLFRLKVPRFGRELRRRKRGQPKVRHLEMILEMNQGLKLVISAFIRNLRMKLNCGNYMWHIITSHCLILRHVQVHQKYLDASMICMIKFASLVIHVASLLQLQRGVVSRAGELIFLVIFGLFCRRQK